MSESELSFIKINGFVVIEKAPKTTDFVSWTKLRSYSTLGRERFSIPRHCTVNSEAQGRISAATGVEELKNLMEWLLPLASDTAKLGTNRRKT